MEGFLTILALFAGFLPILLVIGLIKPKVVLVWSINPTRWKVFGWWFLLDFVCLIAFGLLHERFESNKTPEEIISSSQTDIEKGRYDTAIKRLKRIAPEDSLFQSAQELIYKADRLIIKKNINPLSMSIIPANGWTKVDDVEKLVYIDKGGNAPYARVVLIVEDVPYNVETLDDLMEYKRKGFADDGLTDMSFVTVNSMRALQFTTSKEALFFKTTHIIKDPYIYTIICYAGIAKDWSLLLKDFDTMINSLTLE